MSSVSPTSVLPVVPATPSNVDSDTELPEPPQSPQNQLKEADRDNTELGGLPQSTEPALIELQFPSTLDRVANARHMSKTQMPLLKILMVMTRIAVRRSSCATSTRVKIKYLTSRRLHW